MRKYGRMWMCFWTTFWDWRGATAPPSPRPSHTFSRILQGVTPPRQVGRQITQGIPLAQEAGRRGLFMVHFPDPARVDC